MKFTIDASPSAGLKVIEEIPNFALARLEGGNGIGKTVAIRLLSLLTGEQPWAARDPAWETFRNNLGETTVTVSGLRTTADGDSTSELVWHLDPVSQDWPTEPATSGPWLTAELDGSAIAGDALRRLLLVRRVGGDESLSQSLAQEVARDLELHAEAARRFADARATWDAHLRTVQSASSVDEPEDLERLDKRVKDLGEELKEAEALATRLEHRRNGIQTAVDVASRLLRMTDLPAMQAELESLDALRSSLLHQLALLDERAAVVQQTAKKQQDTVRQLRQAEDLLAKRRDRLRRRQLEVAELSSPLHLEPSASSAEVEAKRKEIEAERDLYVELRREYDRSGLIVEVADSVSPALRRAIQEGLGDGILARIGDTEVSIVQLASGVDEQRAHLLDHAGTDSAMLQEQLATLESQLETFPDLRRMRRLRQTAEDDVAVVAAEIEGLVSSLQGEAQAEYREILAQREATVEQHAETVAQHQALQQELEEIAEYGEPEAVRDELDRLRLTNNLVEGVDLETQRLECEAELAEARSAIIDLTAERKAARADYRSARELVQAATLRLTSPEWDWLWSDALPCPKESDSPHEQSAALARIFHATESLRSRLLQLENAHDAISRALTDLESDLSRERTVRAPDEDDWFGLSVLPRYEALFAEHLNTEVVRAALFDNGSDLSISLADLSISWTTPSGERRTRPLEAFSSGQHALAYTRVQLERLREVPALNRVVFLDEFGAYIDRDRLEDLEDFVRKHALGSLADQIVIILPRTDQDIPKGSFTGDSYFVEDLHG